jgi:hypothetical protein
MSYLEMFGNRVTEVRSRKSKSVKQRVMDSIRSEINLLNDRKDLTLQKISKRVDGVVKEVNENRFWKPSNTSKDKVIFNIKVKGKIFGFGEEVDRYSPKYFECENNKKALIEMLEDFNTKLDGIEENDDKFWFLGNKPTNEKVEETA